MTTTVDVRTQDHIQMLAGDWQRLRYVAGVIPLPNGKMALQDKDYMKRGKGQNQMLWPLMESELMSDRVFQRLYIEGSYFPGKT